MSIEEVKKFIIDGSYAKLKHEEEKLKVLKTLIRDEQDRLNNNRMVWSEHGVIGEFVTNKLYDYDNKELNVLLYDLGLLPVISYLNTKLLSTEEVQFLKPFQILGVKYIRYTPNTFGKMYGVSQGVFIENILEISLSDKVALWKKTFQEVELLRTTWERKRKLAAIAPYFTSISFEMGTISILESPVRFKSDKVFKLLNKEVFLNCAVVDIQRIIEYTARGFLKKSELNKLRKITDIQRKYILITLQREQNKRMYWQSKLELLSKLSY